MVYKNPYKKMRKKILVSGIKNVFGGINSKNAIFVRFCKDFVRPGTRINTGFSGIPYKITLFFIVSFREFKHYRV